MNTELLLDQRDSTLGCYNYVIFNTGERKYLQSRLEEEYYDDKNIKTSKIEIALEIYAKSINATSYTLFLVKSENSNPIELKTITLSQ